MGMPKGTKLKPFSEEQRRHMSEARRASPKVQAHHIRMREVMKGRHPKQATASSLANRALRKLGLTKKEAPKLYLGYFDFYMRRYV